jgi:ribosomal protein S18 acetylase RimI-like enzyme
MLRSGESDSDRPSRYPHQMPEQSHATEHSATCLQVVACPLVPADGGRYAARASMNLSIQEFSKYDLSVLYGLVADVYTTSEGMSETLEDRYPTLASFAIETEAFLSVAGAIALVAEIDRQPKAYITIKPKAQSRLKHTAELNMGVHSSARGNGIGKRLVGEALRRAEESDLLEIVYLFVRADNQPGVRLYEKAGFERLTVLSCDTKIGNDYYDAVLMRKFVKESVA